MSERQRVNDEHPQVGALFRATELARCPERVAA